MISELNQSIGHQGHSITGTSWLTLQPVLVPQHVADSEIMPPLMSSIDKSSKRSSSFRIIKSKSFII